MTVLSKKGYIPQNVSKVCLVMCLVINAVQILNMCWLLSMCLSIDNFLSASEKYLVFSMARVDVVAMSEDAVRNNYRVYKWK